MGVERSLVSPEILDPYFIFQSKSLDSILTRVKKLEEKEDSSALNLYYIEKTQNGGPSLKDFEAVLGFNTPITLASLSDKFPGTLNIIC
jgi:hypothetical protein